MMKRSRPRILQKQSNSSGTDHSRPKQDDRMIQALRSRLEVVQSYLNFENCHRHPQFNTPKGLGRVGLLGCLLGLVCGFHVLLCLVLSLCSSDRIDPKPNAILPPFLAARSVLLWQWSAYVVALCTFHLAEFFVTAAYNPTVASADSFLVNHSTAYTAAALTSWVEFWFRWLFFPRWFHNSAVTCVGLMGVVASQIVRSVAMATAGESFNHYIQTSKKDNHVLVTRGVYRYLRHPSYVGFYYWSVATQLLLGNYVHAACYAVVTWRFFEKRIAYEEESLKQFFPDEYPAYVARSYTGIPFLRTQIDYTNKRE